MSEGNWAKTCTTCGHRYKWTGPMLPEPPCPQCKRRLDAEQAKKQSSSPPAKGIRIPTSGDRDDRVADALALCDQIESTAEDVPEAGEDFAMSVTEKAASIRETIERTERVSDNQFTALENFLSGLQRWIRD